MLREFFEISDEDTAAYFRDKQIWSQGEVYQKEQGRYPVIFLTFKDVKFQTWEETMENLRHILRSEFNRHGYILNSDQISDYSKEYFRSVVSGTATEVALSSALG